MKYKIGDQVLIREDLRDDEYYGIKTCSSVYKRQIEDMVVAIRRWKRERENMLDLSPSHAQSLVLASDFDAKTYVDKDIDLGVKIRNEEIKLEIAKKQYDYLFGGM